MSTLQVYTLRKTFRIYQLFQLFTKETSHCKKINLTLERVQEKIKKLNANKSPGPDEFYPREIKEIENEVAPHFYDVYRASLDEKKSSIRLEITECCSFI